MFDPEKKQALATSLKADQTSVMDVVTSMSPSARDELWEVLDSMRPVKSLAALNLEHELIDQYDKIKRLQADVMSDNGVPANQRAQVANAVASTLQQMVKMQSDFYNAERFKAIEALVLKAVKTLPKDVAEKFVEDYERIEL